MERLVFDEPLDPAAVRFVAEGLGWSATGAEDSREPMLVCRFRAPDGAAAWWVDDPGVGRQYLLVPSRSGPAWRQALARQGLLLDREAALAQAAAATTPLQVRAAIALLGLFAYGPFCDEVYARITAALASPDDGVRAEALSAVTMSGWSEFGAALRAVPGASGADLAWQREAAEVAAAMEAGGWNRDFYAADPMGP